MVRELADLPEDVAASAELVISELVTTAITHGGLWPSDLVEVVLRRDDDRVTIEVDDGDGFYGRSERPFPLADWSGSASRCSTYSAIGGRRTEDGSRRRSGSGCRYRSPAAVYRCVVGCT
jgi:hypothetical protein